MLDMIDEALAAVALDGTEHREETGVNERGRAMAAMYAEGYTLDDISRKYGVSRQRVHQIIGNSYERAHWGKRKKDALRERRLAAYARIVSGESTLAQEAEAEGVKAVSLRAFFYEEGLRLTAPAPEHGTPYRYKRGCRCEECTEAVRSARLRWKKSRYGREPPSHGTETAYKNWGCRCPACRVAGAESNRRGRLGRQRRALLELPGD